ncbi:MAG: hypothetical protein E6G97_18260 [Alphaproteobacteria bacterium]|nr:MAG: hypothetical protein E6G97_18260 [Alphaproteobacteria bacterium]
MNKKSAIFVEIIGSLLVIAALALIVIGVFEGLCDQLDKAKCRAQREEFVRLAALKAASCLHNDRVQSRISVLDAEAHSEQEADEGPTRRPEIVDRRSQVNDQGPEAELFMKQKWISVYAQGVGPTVGPRLVDDPPTSCCGSTSRWGAAIRRWGRVE